MRMAGIMGPKPCCRLSEVALPNLQQRMAAAPTLSLKRRNDGCHAHYGTENRHRAGNCGTACRAGHDVYATMRGPERAPQLQTIAKQDDLPITVLNPDVD